MNHLKHMAIGAVVILAGLLAFGVPLTTALQYALFLSCPLMMIGMMLFMNHGHGHGHGHSSDGSGHDDSQVVHQPSTTEPDPGHRP